MDKYEALSSLEIYCMNLEHAKEFHPESYKVFQSIHESLRVILPLAKKQLSTEAMSSIIHIAKDSSRDKDGNI